MKITNSYVDIFNPEQTENKNKKSISGFSTKKLKSNTNVFEALNEAIFYQTNVHFQSLGTSISISYEAALEYTKFLDSDDYKPLATLNKLKNY